MLRKLTVATLVSVAISACSSQGSAASEGDATAVDPAQQALEEVAASILAPFYRCPSSESYFVIIRDSSNSNYQYEFRNVKLQLSERQRPLSEADQLNGIENRVIVTARDIAYRVRLLDQSPYLSNEWTEWRAGIKFLGGETDHLFEVRRGRWTYVGAPGAMKTFYFSPFDPNKINYSGFQPSRCPGGASPVPPKSAQDIPKSDDPQISEAIALVRAAQTAVKITIAEGSVPRDRSDASLSPDATDTMGKYVQSVDVVRGTVIATFSDQADAELWGKNIDAELMGKTIAFQPYRTSENKLVWVCGYAQKAGSSDLRPVSDQAPSAAATTSVPAKFLPAECR
ncbi:MAG: pilin [Pseudomonadota bacterium]